MRGRVALKPGRSRRDVRICQVRIRFRSWKDPAAKSRSFETTAEANYTRRY